MHVPPFDAAKRIDHLAAIFQGSAFPISLETLAALVVRMRMFGGGGWEVGAQAWNWEAGLHLDERVKDWTEAERRSHAGDRYVAQWEELGRRQKARQGLDRKQAGARRELGKKGCG